MGLLNAVNRFDIDTGADFVAFAVPTITGEVRRHFRDHGWSVKVPRRLKDLHMQINRARLELSQQLNRAPTATEIANYLGTDREAVIEAVIAGSAYSTLSSDTVAARADGSYLPLKETLGDVDASLAKGSTSKRSALFLHGCPNATESSFGCDSSRR